MLKKVGKVYEFGLNSHYKSKYKRIITILVRKM